MGAMEATVLMAIVPAGLALQEGMEVTAEAEAEAQAPRSEVLEALEVLGEEPEGRLLQEEIPRGGHLGEQEAQENPEALREQSISWVKEIT